MMYTRSQRFNDEFSDFTNFMGKKWNELSSCTSIEEVPKILFIIYGILLKNRWYLDGVKGMGSGVQNSLIRLLSRRKKYIPMTSYYKEHLS